MGKEGGVRGNEGMGKREIGEVEGPSSQILLGSQQCPWNECVTGRLLWRNQKLRESHALGGNGHEGHLRQETLDKTLSA